MSASNAYEPRRSEHGALVSGAMVLVLTSVHHVYGAIRYDTPERYHAALLAGAAVIVMLGGLAFSRARLSDWTGRVAWWLFWGVNATIPVLLFGVFEGVYNHALKVALYFGGAPLALIRSLFPAPTYEMPNDVFFEVTGVLQAAPAAVAAYHLMVLLVHRQHRPLKAWLRRAV